VKLVEALEVLKRNPPTESAALEVQLACGFTPLHFLTFLGAHLRGAFPDHRVSIPTGTFGDLPGNLERLRELQNGTVVAVLEWPDFDPRLGIRILGGWKPNQLAEFAGTVRERAERIVDGLRNLARRNIVITVLPTLPVPPITFMPSWCMSQLEAELARIRGSLSQEIVKLHGVRLVSQQKLDMISPTGDRFDAKSELNTGFPYSLSHADKLAELVANLIRNPQPKKGLITDLDNTFWMGILGEVNPEGISWDLDHHSQKHGIYQQFLASLAESGVLIGVASKNDPALVEEAFLRRKPAMAKEMIFPIVANWGPKSESVARIISAWNIGADSVVFVDDSPLELAEVQAVHPDVECVLFPKDDDKAAFDLLFKLRDKFGKMAVTDEDALRLESLRASQAITEASSGDGYTPERFLQEVQGKLSISYLKEPADPRALELINKTNQFNLNGKRHTETSWRQYLNDPKAFLMLVSYEDKFGPLGKIAVMAGHVENSKITIDHWVMSCRAFSRRIEHGCMFRAFEKFGAEQATFDFVRTQRNQPLQDFFRELTGVAEVFAISKQELTEKCPPLYFEFQES
jgi:FkbH-like protein